MYPTSRAAPTLKAILSRYGVSEERLRKECREEVLLKIASKPLEWEILGRYLDVPRQKLTAIDRQKKNEDQKKLEMLDTWHERKGSEATYLDLAHALYEHGRRDLVELLCQILTTSITAKKDLKPEHCGVARRMETLEQTFNNLHRRLQSELTEGEGVSAVDFLHSLSMLPVAFRNEFENTIHKMLRTVSEYNEKVTVRLFLHFSPLFLFLDFSLLRHLIARFGSTTLKEDMKAYVAEVTMFMRETTVADVMDLLPGHEILHLNYSKVKAKFAGDPKTCTLEMLNRIRKTIFSEVRLSKFIFWVISMETAGSFIVYWLIPTSVVPDLIKAAKHFDKTFCMKQGLLSLSLIESIDACTSLESDVWYYTPCIEDFKDRIKKGIHDNMNIRLTNREARELIEENVTLECTKRDLLTNQQSYTVFVNQDIDFSKYRGECHTVAHYSAPVTRTEEFFTRNRLNTNLFPIIIATAVLLYTLGVISSYTCINVTTLSIIFGLFIIYFIHFGKLVQYNNVTRSTGTNTVTSVKLTAVPSTRRIEESFTRNVTLADIIPITLVLIIGYIEGGAAICIVMVLGFGLWLVLIRYGELAFTIIKYFLKEQYDNFIRSRTNASLKRIVMQLGEVTNTGTGRMRITMKRQ